jgi:hypothetical protein
VATTAEAYTLCGRIFPDPHAYWPAPAQAPGHSPFGGRAVVKQLSATGLVLASAPPGLLTTVAGATQVRIVFIGGLTGSARFDDVGLWEA